VATTAQASADISRSFSRRIFDSVLETYPTLLAVIDIVAFDTSSAVPLIGYTRRGSRLYCVDGEKALDSEFSPRSDRLQ